MTSQPNRRTPATESSDRASSEMVRGAGVLAVLTLLSEGESYGYELVERMALRTGGFLDLGQATVYPLLYNLEAKGMLSSRRQRVDNGRMRKYYRLTPAGVKELRNSRSNWQRLVQAMAGLDRLDEEVAL